MKEEKELKKRKEEKKDWWWTRLPRNIKMIILGLIFIVFYQAQQSGEPVQWMYIAFLVGVAWLLGKEKKIEEPINEFMAIKLTKEKIEEKILYGDLPKGTLYWVGENAGLKVSKGYPIHYLVEVTLKKPNGRKIYKQAKVDIKTLDVTLQDSIGKITGREPVPTRIIIPEFLEQIKKYPDLGKSEVLRYLSK